MPNISKNLEIILNSIKLINKDNQFNQKIKIIAVTKTFDDSVVLKALKSGILSFGENKVKECQLKFHKIIKDFPSTDLHLIGHLQTNKVKDALNLFHTIHTLDRERLGIEIKKRLSTTTVTKNFFIQVNIGGELQKTGINLKESDEFIKWCKADLKLNIIGLMCIPPEKENPKNFFLKLKDISIKNGLNNLSMGMSNDYLDAIACGATHIRLGTAIFGKRE